MRSTSIFHRPGVPSIERVATERGEYFLLELGGLALTFVDFADLAAWACSVGEVVDAARVIEVDRQIAALRSVVREGA